MNEITNIIYSCEKFLNSCENDALISDTLDKILLTLYNIPKYSSEDIINILLFLLDLKEYNLTKKNNMLLNSIISKIKIFILEENENQLVKKVDIFSSIGNKLGFSYFINM